MFLIEDVDFIFQTSHELRISFTSAEYSIHNFDDVRNTTASAGPNSKDTGGTSPAVIAVAVALPLIAIGVVACIIYVWYRRKYPVRMIVGKDFAKFSNPAYNKRSSTATLVRERAALDDDYQRDIEEGAAYTGVAHDNPALNMEDDPQYQPIPSLEQSMATYANYRRSFEDSPKSEKRAPEKPKRMYSVEPQPDDNHEDEQNQSEGHLQGDESANYENVDYNITNKKADQMIQCQDDVTSEKEARPESTAPAYEDVLTAEEDHAYETTAQNSGQAVDLKASFDDSTLYENLTFKGDTETKGPEIAAVPSPERILDNPSVNPSDNPSDGECTEERLEDSSGTKDLTDHESSFGNESSFDTHETSVHGESSSSHVIETLRPPDLEGEDNDRPQPAAEHDRSLPESFSNDSFVILDNQDQNETDRGNKASGDNTEERQLDHIEDQKVDLFEKLENDKLVLSNKRALAHDGEKSEEAVDVVADRSFDLDVDHLNISVSSISDPDVKSVDSAFSIVSRGLNSVDETSDSFEVISHDFGQISQDDIKLFEDEHAEEAILQNSKHEAETSVTTPADNVISPSSKPIKPDVIISEFNSSESDISDNDELTAGEEIENSRETSGDRRESVTRKITLDRGGISFEDSTSGSSSQSENSESEDVEMPKPNLARRESITLDNPVFDSPEVNISFKFTSNENSDKQELPRGLTRRKSITLDNPLFEKVPEMATSTGPEVSPLDSFQVIESEPLDEPISEESEDEAEEVPNSKLPVPQRKVLKITMDIGEEEDSSISSVENSNSESDSSTEA